MYLMMGSEISLISGGNPVCPLAGNWRRWRAVRHNINTRSTATITIITTTITIIIIIIIIIIIVTITTWR